MAYENLIVIDRGACRVIEVNRPKALNALNRSVINELSDAFDDVNRQQSVRAVVLTGVGDKAFVAGADVGEMRGLSPFDAERFSDEGHALMDKIESARVPVVAAVNGFALGGGLELALACDFIYAAENATLGLVEVNLGLIPGFGGTTRLARRVGIALARELIFTARKLKAPEAHRIGLVNRIVAPDAVVDEAVKVGERIADKGPIAVQMAKRLLLNTQDCDHRTANAMERQSFGLIFGTSDCVEGIGAFLDKRQPTFTGK